MKCACGRCYMDFESCDSGGEGVFSIYACPKMVRDGGVRSYDVMTGDSDGERSNGCFL